jgi:hypothetical protein
MTISESLRVAQEYSDQQLAELKAMTIKAACDSLLEKRRLEKIVSKQEEALSQIANPLLYFQNNLKKGERLDGMFVQVLINDANYLKGIAVECLSELETLKKG